MNRLVDFLRREDGPTAVEYAVMLALIIVVCVVAISLVGPNEKKEKDENAKRLDRAEEGLEAARKEIASIREHEQKLQQELDATRAKLSEKRNAEKREGVILSAKDSKLIMTQGEREEEYFVPSDATVMIDREGTTLEKLQPKMRVRVTVKGDDKKFALRVEALDKLKEFDAPEKP